MSTTVIARGPLCVQGFVLGSAVRPSLHSRQLSKLRPGVAFRSTSLRYQSGQARAPQPRSSPQGKEEEEEQQQQIHPSQQTSTAREERKTAKSEEPGGFTKQYGPVPGRTGFTFFTDDAAEIVSLSESGRLGRILPSGIGSMAFSKEPGACTVVFATPSFLPMLQSENDTLTRKIAHTAFKSAKKGPEEKLEIVIAVVPRIPLPGTLMQKPLSPSSSPSLVSNQGPPNTRMWGAEGISVSTLALIGEDGFVAEGGETQSSDFLTRPGTLVITPNIHEEETQVNESSALSLELFNTVMHTGRPHFLVHQTWSRSRKPSKEDRGVQKIAERRLSACVIAHRSTHGNFLSEHLLTFSRGRSVFCTVARKIVSAEGNVISLLENTKDKKKPLPASIDLQDLGEDFFDGFLHGREECEIWAVVYPSDRPSWSRKRSQKQSFGWNLSQGARFYRVRSGGPGWAGGVGGPISLATEDNATYLGDDGRLHYSRFSSVQAGDEIRFLAVGRLKDQPGGEYYRSAPDANGTGPNWLQRFKFISGPTQREWDPVTPVGPHLVVPDYLGAMTTKMRLRLSVLGYVSLPRGEVLTETELPPYSSLMAPGTASVRFPKS